VSVLYQWGHPFEHQLSDAPKPATVVVTGPEGKDTTLTGSLSRVEVAAAEGKKVVGYRVSFKADRRGDYTVCLTTAPVWDEEAKQFHEHEVKAVVHVEAQKNWDADAKRDLDLLPLTRPYGLTPGSLFQVRFRSKSGGIPNAHVEAERYNQTPPKVIPADELVTQAMKTDPNGVATTILPGAGWWCLSASVHEGTREHQGKRYPVKRQVTFWVHVQEAPARK
jgi:cobalt/nickel transport protein